MWVKSENLRKWVFAYLALPNLIFMIGFLRWEILLPAVFFLVAALISIWRGGNRRDVVLEPLVPSADCVHLPMRWAVAFAVAVTLWCIMAGQGGFVVQTTDWNWRNATFRDLITHEWPVRYDDFGRALVFYVGHWLPAAVVGKAVFGLTGDLSIAWRAGNVALLVWTASGLLIALAQLSLLLKADSPLRRFGVLALLIFFGGMDALGAWGLNIKQILSGCAPLNPWLDFGELWAPPFNYPSNSSCLYWAFHQTAATWIAVFYIARGVRMLELAFVVSLVSLSAPLPNVGLAFIAAALVLRRLAVSRRDAWDVVKAAVSVPNITGVAVVTPLVAALLCANDQTGGITFAWYDMGAGFFFRRCVFFLCFEIGLYFVLSYKWFYRSTWWWTALIWLCICPAVKVGEWADFCMKAMMPAFAALSVMAAFSFIRYRCCRDWRAFALAGCLAVGAYVPVKEILWYAYRTAHVGVGVVVEDRIGTFDQDVVGRYGENCGKMIVSMCNVSDPDSRFFYRWMARKHSRKEKVM